MGEFFTDEDFDNISKNVVIKEFALFIINGVENIFNSLYFYHYNNNET
jgi:hypothetical protein